MRTLTRFLKDEDGAVTVDWVVLTASVVVLAMLITYFLREPIFNMLTFIAEEVMVAETFFDV
jgi:Flp pilus assembly pilin Flp